MAAHTLLGFPTPLPLGGLAPLAVGAPLPLVGTGPLIGNNPAAISIQYITRMARYRELFYLRTPVLRRAGRRIINGRSDRNNRLDGTMRNNESWIGQMVGHAPITNCTRCSGNNPSGQYTRCIVVPQGSNSTPVDYACMNCLYQENTGRCSIRQACKVLKYLFFSLSC
jgi:hypothetical protein